MPITEYNGIVINKLTLEQYKELKAANQTVASQTYVITDIDEQLEALELPNRLKENIINSQVIDNIIDVVATGFYLWDCENTQYRPNSTEQYYYVISNRASQDDGRYWGTQIAIGESTNKMYIRSRGDNQVWNKWERMLGETDNLCWQFREGKVINSDNDFSFFNTNFVDFSDIPINTTLISVNGKNGNIIHYRLIIQQGVYKFAFTNNNNTYVMPIASGNDLYNMSWVITEDTFGSSDFGEYVKVVYVNPTYLDVIDNLIRINNFNF